MGAVAGFSKVAVVGLGYVGLPLAVALGRHWPTLGFDHNEAKVEAYRAGTDPMGELTPEELSAATHLEFSTQQADLAGAEVIIIAVPTPVTETHAPDLTPLQQASQLVGEQMSPGTIVVYESTVYPGTTEEVCIPILERASGLRWKEGFYVGYSPERVNPGDHVHRLETITKVVSGDEPATLERLATLYGSIVKAGIHRASSIKVAEASKVIENTQRDLNIALTNEFAMIFHKLGIESHEVFKAAQTKWNFLPFRPGLVGGHCIGVDPYYLVYRAEISGYHPDVIMAGRRINDGMGKFVAEQTIKEMIALGVNIKGARVGIFGLAFKENTSDLRNTRVVDIIRELESYGVEVLVHDAVANAGDALQRHGITLRHREEMCCLDALMVTVAHQTYVQAAPAYWRGLLKSHALFVDVKSVIDTEALGIDGLRVWRL